MDTTLEALRSLADDLVALKQENADAVQLEHAIKAGQLLMLKLREQHRVACIESERLKEDTAAHKALLDEFNLQLQNLLYEKQYYEKEIAGNQAFKSAIPDEDIVLLPLPELQAAAAAAGEQLPADEHQLMLARLSHEEKQRKDLTKQLQALEALKQQKAAAVAARKAQLDELHNQLRVLGQAAKPLQDVLLPSQAQRAQNRVAELLPAPLYILYSQYTAGRDMLGLEVDVRVAGSPEEAQRLASNSEASASGAATAQQQGQPAQPASKRRRKEAAATAAEDELYKVHPLSVELVVLAPAAGSSGTTHSSKPLMTVTFQHFTSLNLVGAHGSGSEDETVLSNLFLGDNGDASQFEGLLQASKGQQLEFGSSRVKSKPYKWAQDLAGMDILSTLPPSLSAAERAEVLEQLSIHRRQQRMQVVLERLQSSKQAMLGLKQMLRLLAKKSFPPTSLDASLPQRLTSTIVSWQQITNSSSRSKSGHRPSSGGEAAAAAEQAGSSQGGPPKASGGSRPPTPLQGQQQQPPPPPRSRAPTPRFEEGELQADGPAAAAATGAAQGLEATNITDDALLESLLMEEAGGSGSWQRQADEAAAAAAAAPMEDGGLEEGEAVGAALEEEGGALMLAEDLMLVDRAAAEHLAGLAAADSDGEGGGGGDSTAAARAKAAAAAAGGGDAAAAAASVLLPPVLEYKLVVRAGRLELVAVASVYQDYPLHPPRWEVASVAEVRESGKTGAAQHLPGEVLWLERQVNVAAVSYALKRDEKVNMLALQILFLRCCLEELAKQQAAEADSDDLLRKLQVKQQLRGRDRHATLLLGL